jgi:hypothetical protein
MTTNRQRIDISGESEDRTYSGVVQVDGTLADLPLTGPELRNSSDTPS